MKIREGNVAYINEITIKGNSSISTAEILKMIEFEKEDTFNPVEALSITGEPEEIKAV